MGNARDRVWLADWNAKSNVHEYRTSYVLHLTSYDIKWDLIVATVGVIYVQYAYEYGRSSLHRNDVHMRHLVS